MRRFLPLLALLACTGEADRHAAAATATVRAFETALRTGDRAGLRALVTDESRPAIEHLPFEAVAGKAPMRVLDATAHGSELHVRVEDEAAGGKAGAFVVVRENGAWRVDLVATAGLTAVERALPGPRERVVVRPLTPAQRAEAEALATR